MLQCQIKYLLKANTAFASDARTHQYLRCFPLKSGVLICFNLEHRMAIKNQKHSCHRFGGPRFNEPPPHLSDLWPRFLTTKWLRHRWRRPSLDWRSQRERTGSATDMFALTVGLGWNFSSWAPVQAAGSAKPGFAAAARVRSARWGFPRQARALECAKRFRRDR